MNRSDPQKRILDWIESNAWWAMVLGLPGLGTVLAHFAKWSPAELTLMIAVLFAAAIAATGLLFWRRVRMAQIEFALKQAMLERGLSAGEIERLLVCQMEPPPPPLTEAEVVQSVAACLHQSGISETVIEQVFAAVRTADPATRQALCYALRGLSGDAADEAEEKKVIATLRGFSGDGHATESTGAALLEAGCTSG